MDDESTTVEQSPRRHPDLADKAFERVRADFAALLHGEILPVLESSALRLRSALDAMADVADATDAVVATTAAMGEVLGAEHRLRHVLATALDADPDPDLVRNLTASGRRLGAEGRFSFDFHDTRSREIPRPLERALLHIGLEALESTARHSGATRVRVRLADRLSGIELTVADNGGGLGQGRTQQADQLGMRIMNRRATAVGGWVRVEPGLVGGTVVTCWVPAPRPDEVAVAPDRSAAS